MPIVYDENDKWRFIKSLHFFNDELGVDAIFQKLNSAKPNVPKANVPKAAFGNFFGKGYRSMFDFQLPINWPDQRPLVKILCFFLAENHFHLLLKEIQERGIARFMEKLGTGFTNYINLKYEEVGRVFQGPYKGRTVRDMTYLQYLNVYIQVFNAFEIYPGGISKAATELDKAFDYAFNYQFGSLGDFWGGRERNIIAKDVFEEMFPNIEVFKEFTYDCLTRKDLRKILGKLTID